MRQVMVVAALVAVAGIAGCRVDSKKEGEGDNVKIATPFGGMQVKTDNADVLTGLGLPLYPNSTPVKKDKINGKDSGSADVNMSFGSFQLRVKAAEYRTDDTPDKLLVFYKKALGRYGDVIQCDNHRPVGTPTHTAEGLTCEENEGSGKVHINVNDNQKDSGVFHGNAKVQLKAGSKKHQHIVDINPDGGGTKFGLVALDLPVDFHFGDSGNKDDKDKDDSQ